MNLDDVVLRRIPPEPWDEGDKIPWDDLEFSKRMLREHLSQAHDLASRRSELIDRHVNWIHDELLHGKPGRILDLGCGPGLYTSRLAALGHDCRGIDFAPASIAYAREQSAKTTRSAIYLQGDVRTTEYGDGYDFVMMVFGELNTFRIGDAQSILRRAREALAPEGILLLEAHTFNFVESTGHSTTTWRTSQGGLFSEEPHLVLTEHFWHERESIATERTFVIHAATASVDRYVQTMQAYTLDDYRSLLNGAGFRLRDFYPAMPGMPETDEFVVLVADTSESAPI